VCALEEDEPVVTVAAFGDLHFLRLRGGGEMRPCWETVIVLGLDSVAISEEAIILTCIRDALPIVVAHSRWQYELD